MARSTVFEGLVGLLEKKINRMRPGDRLPAEQAMADDFSVSKPTLRRALARLAENGLIQKRNGVGNIVAARARVIDREMVFLCHDLAFFNDALVAFSLAAARAHYLCSIVPLAGDGDARERVAAGVAAKKPAGIVCYADLSRADPGMHRALAESGVPLLYLMRRPRNVAANLLAFAGGDGIVAVVKRFYQRGCRRFALYGDEAVNPLAAVERAEGFQRAMKQLRLRPRGDYRCLRPTERPAFVELFRDARRRPDAVVCLNDLCAGNLYRALSRAGIDARGVRFSGFDASPASEFFPFGLLTVRPPMAEMGRLAAAMLIRQIENPGFAPATRRLASRLVESGGEGGRGRSG